MQHWKEPEDFWTNDRHAGYRSADTLAAFEAAQRESGLIERKTRTGSKKKNVGLSIGVFMGAVGLTLAVIAPLILGNIRALFN